MSRLCADTGLSLVSDQVRGYRIAKVSYGPVNPLPQPDKATSRAAWSRFDTPGSTIYLADSRRTAYAETLAWARMTPSHRQYLQKTADFFGISVEEMNELVYDDWTASGNMVPGWIPADWRHSRLIHCLRVEEPGYWVDLTADESIAVLNRELGEELDPACGVPFVTLATLTGENREATTMIATWIREQILDDGSYPLGVKFHSKHGGGTCWAFWMRRRDDGLGPEKITELSSFEIKEDATDYLAALDGFDIQSR